MIRMESYCHKFFILSEIMIEHKIEDIGTYKLGTVLHKTETVHIKYFKLALDVGHELKRLHDYCKFAQNYIQEMKSKLFKEEFKDYINFGIYGKPGKFKNSTKWYI
jgi:hypothetical protein